MQVDGVRRAGHRLEPDLAASGGGGFRFGARVQLRHEGDVVGIGDQHLAPRVDGDAAPLSEDETRQRNIVLDRGPKETGGRRENIISSQSIGRELDELATELLGQVVVTYASPQRLIPAEKITISASRDGINARGVPVRTPAAPPQER